MQFLHVSLVFTVRRKPVSIDFKKTVTVLPFRKSGHTDVFSTSYFLLFDSHIVGSFFLFIQTFGIVCFCW